MSLRSTRGRSKAVAVPCRLSARVDRGVGDGAWRHRGARACAICLVGGGQSWMGDPEKNMQNPNGLDT